MNNQFFKYTKKTNHNLSISSESAHIVIAENNFGVNKDFCLFAFGINTTTHEQIIVLYINKNYSLTILMVNTFWGVVRVTRYIPASNPLTSREPCFFRPDLSINIFPVKSEIFT